jgi:cobalt-zinc-cadmium efflux system membrane fusion protein
MTLADVGTVWVLADVYEKDLGQIREGQAVEIVSPAYPDKTFRGRLTYISDVLEKETRTARVRCVLSNQDRLLKLEMFVSARVPTIRKKTAVAVPVRAIQNIDGKDVVFVVEGPGHFRSVAIETGLRSDDWIEAKGMEPDVGVVSYGSFHLKSILKRSEIQADDD